MAIKPKCVEALNQAAGRVLRQSELDRIEGRIASAMSTLARSTPQWRSMSAAERVQAAAQLASKELTEQAARRLANSQRQVLASQALEERIDAIRQEYGFSRTDALKEDMRLAQIYIDGLKREAVAGLIQTVEAASSVKGVGAGRRGLMFLFDAENPQMTRDLVSEIFDNAKGATGNDLARKGARAWLDTVEAQRLRFNGAGGDVGRLDYGYLPQPHDSLRVRAAGRDAWVAKTLPKLDRARYTDDAGRPLGDESMVEFLNSAYKTIATDGLNKAELGAYRSPAARANHGVESRQIHFRDGDAYLEYMSEFASGGVYDAMVNHVGASARDIGLVERYGPNPEMQMRMQFDIYDRVDGPAPLLSIRPETYWAGITGKTATPENSEAARLAQIAQHARNLNVASKLGSAVVSSLNDMGTLVITTGYNKLSYWNLLRNVTKQADKQTRMFLSAHGVIADSLINDLSRWSGESIQNSWSGRLANSTMKLSLMTVWTDSLRRAFSMTMMQGMARMADKKWGELTEWDRSHMTRKGLTEADWDVITRAQLTEFDGRDLLTPEAIRATDDPRANEVIAKVLGLISDESEYAVIGPDLTAKAIQTMGGLRAGTVGGELARTTMQFKTFPVAMITRHWRRMMEGTRGLDGAPLIANRAAYALSMSLSLMALGAIVQQVKQIRDGKDPRDMTDKNFWGQALLQGGGLSIVGDLLFSDPSDSPGSAAASLLRNVAGPTLGMIGDAYNLTVANAWEVAKGKDSNAGAEAVRFAKSNLPYINLWYSKAAVEHMFLHSLQENLSPGYLNRMRARAQRDWGQAYWWEPGEALPDRAPDMGAALGVTP
jgi:hypothetical protein